MPHAGGLLELVSGMCLELAALSNSPWSSSVVLLRDFFPFLDDFLQWLALAENQSAD